jgi:mannose-6-phosphate isomerase-like protein (cupin superfamily)
MQVKVINLQDKFAKIKAQHEYKVVAQMNDYLFKLMRMQREFIWHKHPETDEAFMVIEGEMQIHLRDQVLELGQGDMVVIPRGVEHKPVSQTECKVMLIEPEETINTGDARGELTDTNLEWI